MAKTLDDVVRELEKIRQVLEVTIVTRINKIESDMMSNTTTVIEKIEEQTRDLTHAMNDE